MSSSASFIQIISYERKNVILDSVFIETVPVSNKSNFSAQQTMN